MSVVAGAIDERGADFLAGGGEMGRIMRSHDWSSTSLGNPETWSQALRTAVRLLLNTGHPMYIWWGPELFCFYNDAYSRSIGPDRHPSSLGQPGREVWAEIWPIIGPMVDQVMTGGEATWRENDLVPITRFGRREDVYWTYSYSPIDDEDAPGGIGGVLVVCAETTQSVVAQREAEAKSRVNQDRYQTLFRTIENGFCIVEVAFDSERATDYTFVEVNPAFERQTGLVGAQGRSARELVPGLEQHWFDLYGRVAMTGEPHRFENGSEAMGRFFDVYAFRIGEPERRQVALLFTDISERRQAELALERSQAELQDLNGTLEERVSVLAAERDQFWRLSRDPLVICDLEGRWVNASPVWTEILGWRLDELIGRTSSWMEHPDDVSRTKQKVIEVGSGEVLYAFNNRFRGKDGSFHTFSWTAVAKADRLFWVARDVTDDMVRDEALRLYETIVQSDTAPICAFDPEYRQIAFNQAHTDDFFRTYGHRVQVGEVFPNLLLPEQASMICGFIDRALAGEMFTVTAEVGNPDLTVPHWELSYGPLKDADGRIFGAFHHAKDISARVQMQAQLLQTQEVLRQAQKMEAVGQLTGGLAHDFNNLLTGMMGNMELLQLRVARGRLDDLDRFIVAAQGAGRRAASLTQRLLAFSRRQTLDPKPTDVNRLAAGMEDLLRRTVGPTNDIEIVGAAGLWPANIDAGQLENALLNLCINARDAMHDGGRITIETANKWLDERTARERDMAPGQYLSVCVTDTGTGMAPEIIDRVFEPFFTTKPLGEGTGLGLSMIYGFARQSNGQVRIYSEVGSGTTICIYLPRHLGDAVTLEEEEAVAVAAAATGETILVVDDEATIRHLIDEVLDDAGYTVIGAADGAAGIKVVQSGARIDLLITDVGLPGGMNGRQVADAARALRPGLKVLFITGYAENAAVGNGHLEPGMELLTKPFTLEALSTKVADMLKVSNQ